MGVILHGDDPETGEYTSVENFNANESKDNFPTNFSIGQCLDIKDTSGVWSEAGKYLLIEVYII